MMHPITRTPNTDLFSIAAMLQGSPVVVPASSTVPQDKLHTDEFTPLIQVSLQPGAEVEPSWPFAELSPHDLPESIQPSAAKPTTRSRLAWYLTSPHNRRFARTIANRLWKRLMGRGIVEPVDDWEETEPEYPRLLEYLADEFVAHGYDLQHVSQLVLNSEAYQQLSSDEQQIRPPRRRMTAEQLVDSLCVAFGKPLRTEELNLDVTAGRPWNNALNLGYPRRAWQLVGMANNRDRPSLTLPRAQAVVNVMTAFGWRASRQEPTSERPAGVNVLQPAILANGCLGRWLTTLSSDQEITQLCLQDQELGELIEAIYLRVLTRLPTAAEVEHLVAILAEGYTSRRVEIPQPGVRATKTADRKPPLFVTWANHLEPEATAIKLREAEAARRGDPPTMRLTAGWRQRMEDALWAILNLPETIHYP